jgi:hypothetical protein
MAGNERLAQTGCLACRHCPPAGAAVSEDQGSETGQLRRRSLAFR